MTQNGMHATAAQGSAPLLRIAHVWHDEVMADRVLIEPGAVTIGNSKHSTFTVPALGLPDDFTVIDVDGGDYVLHLKQTMAGRMKVGGQEMEVSEFMEKGSGADDRGVDGSFRATRVGPGDWGVIELDGQGEHNLFFQFVKDAGLPKAKTWRDHELFVPALAFSMILHMVLLAIAYQLYEGGNGLVFPGRQAIMTRYIVDRPEPEVKGPSEQSASKEGEKKEVKSATKGKKGKSGGEGKKPRAKDPDAAEVPPEIDVGLVSQESRETIKKLTENRALDDKLQKGLARLQGNKRLGEMGSGPGKGTGLGPGSGVGTTRGGSGKGPGGGGSAHGDFVSQGDVDVGETRAPKGTGGSGRGQKEVAVVGIGDASGDFSGLSKAEIDKVIKSRQGFFKACYQRELNRTRGLGGKLVVNFRINGSGTVTSARVVSGKSTLRNPKVESCVTRQITKLKFPAKGGAVVNYPFIFSQG